jgi:hypothetical protein
MVKGSKKHLSVSVGDFVYIPASIPHLPYNLSNTESCVAVIARTDPNEQESVVLLPELDSIHPWMPSGQIIDAPSSCETPATLSARSKRRRIDRNNDCGSWYKKGRSAQIVVSLTSFTQIIQRKIL